MYTKRQPHSAAELKVQLQEQLDLLQVDCASYDGGMLVSAKRMAVGLRLLFHATTRMRSLAEQLGLQRISYLDSAGKLNPRNLIPECGLLATRMTNLEATFLPKCHFDSTRRRWTTFPTWWNEAVLKDARSRTFSRRDLVTHLADTDGGAHVDPAIDAAYYELSRVGAMGWTHAVGGPMLHPELPCIRQITWEVLETMSRKALWVSKTP